MSMDVSGVSSLLRNQTALGRSEDKTAQDGNDSSGGWKYITVQEGDTVYTYIVIGKNMKVLVGKTAAHKEKDDDKKTAGDKNNSAEQSAVTAQPEKNATEVATNKVDFLTDTRMFALTAIYQKKMRETMKNMEDQIGTGHQGQNKVEETAEKGSVQ